MNSPCDLATIAGQEHAKRAVEVAATGGHNLAFTGGAGNGKTMLARSLSGLLPPLDDGSSRSLLTGHAAMVWVEDALRGHVGTLTLPSHGLLMLERLDCFAFSALQIQRLAEALDQGQDVQMVLTQQPCPCGFYGDPLYECHCSALLIMRYQRRMRALIERVPIAVNIPRPDYERQVATRSPETSARVSERVRAGVAHQRVRFAGLDITRNAEMDHAQLLRFCTLEQSAQKLFQAAHRQLHFSVRAADGVLAVARTIADLADCDQIQANHIAEAVQYQSRRDQL